MMSVPFLLFACGLASAWTRRRNAAVGFWCAGAIVLARLDRVVFGAWDERAGMAGSVADILRHPRLNHRPQVLAGVRAQECAEVLTQFFRAKRQVVDTPSPTV